MNFADLAPYFSDENKAIAFIERLIWPDGPVCPHCQATERQGRIEGKSARPGLRKCGVCRKQYTVKVGTIFEDSHVPMTKWLLVIAMMCQSKKGVSAKQIERQIGVSYKTAWHMCHRIRLAMTQEPLKGKLGGGGGAVEVDETYIGGKARNNPHAGHLQAPQPTVVALIERDGRARTFPMPYVRKGPIQALIRMNVDSTAHIMTDQAWVYRGIDKHFASHGAVNHSKEYVRGVIHTNFAESYFSLLKRGLFGTFHHVSKQHMPRYLREFEFRWNLRHATDGERTVKAIRGTKGKRLYYRTPIVRKDDGAGSSFVR